MSRLRTQIANGLKFSRSLLRGLGRGDFFPADSRRVPSQAPQGSSEEPSHGGFFKRIREESGWFLRSSHRVSIPNLKTNIRILHLTDVHIREQCDWLDELCQALRNEQPDLIAITGDVVTKGWTEAAVHQFFSALPDAPLGRFAVMGNWEHWAGADVNRWDAISSEHNVELLQNRWVEREGLVIAGTDDWLAGTPDIEASLSGRPTNTPLLLLTHSPGYFDHLPRREIDIVLSGHSHGGQFRLPFLGALWVPKGTGERVAGWYEEDNCHLFVSRGIGWSIAPVRLWCPPEMATIRLIPS